MKKPKIMPALAAIVVVAFLVLVVPWRRSEKGTAQAVLTAQVTEGPLMITVRAAGEIRARTASKVIPQIRRGDTVRSIVAEGSRVTNGEVVAEINTDDIDRRILEAELKSADSDSKELSARTEYEIQILDNAAALTAAVQAVESANLELKKFLEGDLPMQIKTAELKVATTASEFDRSIRRHEEAKQILKQGFITEDQMEEERIKMETAKVDKETSVDELRTLKAYTLPLKEAEARNGLAKDSTDLEKTRKKNMVQLETKKQAMDQAKLLQNKAHDDLTLLRSDRTNYTVRSPSSGVVTYGDADASWRRGEVQVGMTLQPGEVLLTIPDMAALQGFVDVPEADIHKVVVGQKATLSIEAVPGRTYAGKVDRVAEVANPGGWLESAVKQFKVQVALEQTTDLRPGFSCDAEIVIDTIPKTLIVPVQAVFAEGDEFFVYLESTLGPQRTSVKVGKTSTTHAEILQGVKKGQTVLLSKPGVPAEASAKKETAK